MNLATQHQTDFRPGLGNALQACVASIFEQPLATVPNFIDDPNGYYEAIQQYTLSTHRSQFYKVQLTPNGLLPYTIPPGSRVIVRGTSPRGSFGHVVVGTVQPDGRTVEFNHDPHPDQTYLSLPLVWCGFFIHPKDHVVVVGGGACGLACVRKLRQERPHTCITLVEGRDRFGGRCCTVDMRDGAGSGDGDGTYDIGAAWVHGNSVESPLVQLAQDMKVELHDVVGFNPWLHPYALPRGTLALYHQGVRVDVKEGEKKEREEKEMAVHLDVQKGWDLYHQLLQRLSIVSSTHSTTTTTLKESIAIELNNMMKEEEEPPKEIALLVVQFGLRMMEYWHGGNRNELSAEEFEGVYTSSSSSSSSSGNKWPLMGDCSGAHCSVQGGMGNLMETFGAHVLNEQKTSFPIQVHMNSIVSSIVTHNHAEEGEEEECSKEEKTKPTTINTSIVTLQDGRKIPPAECIVCTVPLNVLKSKSIRFVPSLPSALHESMAKIKMCNYVKIIMTFQTMFWPKDALFLGALCSPENKSENKSENNSTNSRRKTPLLFDVVANIKHNPKLSHVLCCTIAGTDQPLGMEEESIVEIALTALKEMFFSAEAATPCPAGLALAKKPVVTSWMEDPLSQGAYSYATPSFTESDMVQLAVVDVTEGRCLVLAGEHSSCEYNGSVHGALLEGQRAAEDVLRVLG